VIVVFASMNVGRRKGVILGRCSAQRSDECCAAKCAQQGPLIQGPCDGSLRPQNVLCQCSYDCS